MYKSCPNEKWTHAIASEAVHLQQSHQTGTQRTIGSVRHPTVTPDCEKGNRSKIKSYHTGMRSDWNNVW
ncbi:hypothetical protein TNCV_651361 [Trichonephila clavipes]|nr:hypothetical protein TNCV_651361 [Trichonephila clavipes]